MIENFGKGEALSQRTGPALRGLIWFQTIFFQTIFLIMFFLLCGLGFFFFLSFSFLFFFSFPFFCCFFCCWPHSDKGFASCCQDVRRDSPSLLLDFIHQKWVGESKCTQAEGITQRHNRKQKTLGALKEARQPQNNNNPEQTGQGASSLNWQVYLKKVRGACFEFALGCA